MFATRYWTTVLMGLQLGAMSGGEDWWEEVSHVGVTGKGIHINPFSSDPLIGPTDARNFFVCDTRLPRHLP